MKPLLGIFLSLTLVFVFTTPAQKTFDEITKNKVIKMGMTANHQPYCMADKDDSLIGLEVDMADLLAVESLGIELKIVQLRLK